MLIGWIFVGAVVVGAAAWALAVPIRQAIRRVGRTMPTLRLIKKARGNLAKCTPFPVED